ncbi:MAG TPA: NUDIX domain-containing protein [Anaerovoracaceae bacterium]|nr:NUDIX domain-containing protein [Anaerovoracaceae bacterium]
MSIIYPPDIRLEIISQEMVPEQGFLRVLKSQVKAHYPDGTISEQFSVDAVIRDKLDAVAILGHYRGDDGFRYVYLRSCLRPALSLSRNYEKDKRLEDEYVGNTYELPAGLVELDEVGIVGLQQAAAREFYEEVGFECKPEEMKFLGHRTFPTVGMSGERMFFLETEAYPFERKEPVTDGHPMEQGATIKAVKLSEAIKLCEDGYLPDAKTEIGLHRLAAKYGT